MPSNRKKLSLLALLLFLCKVQAIKGSAEGIKIYAYKINGILLATIDANQWNYEDLDSGASTHHLESKLRWSSWGFVQMFNPLAGFHIEKAQENDAATSENTCIVSLQVNRLRVVSFCLVLLSILAHQYIQYRKKFPPRIIALISLIYTWLLFFTWNATETMGDKSETT